MRGRTRPSGDRAWDACVVGSGAGGGIAAHALTRAGLRVLLLEAGGEWSDARDSMMLAPAYLGDRRGGATPGRPVGEFEGLWGGYDIPGEPYTHGDGPPFLWLRARMLGGRTNVWGRISLRFGPDDFRRRGLDGVGEDWPLGYEELAPYYDRLDRMIGVTGTREGLADEPDGIYLPPLAPRRAERMVRAAAERLGLRCIPSRLSILTRPHGGRPACIECGQCNRGCRIGACFSSPGVLLEPALETGRLEIRTGAMVRSVETGSAGRATGVVYVDTRDGTEHRVEAPWIVLAAGACETTRLLLNSTSSIHPHGLGNHSGHLGRWLSDTTSTEMEVHVPALDGGPAEGPGVLGGHVYIP